MLRGYLHKEPTHPYGTRKRRYVVVDAGAGTLTYYRSHTTAGRVDDVGTAIPLRECACVLGATAGAPAHSLRLVLCPTRPSSPRGAPSSPRGTRSERRTYTFIASSAAEEALWRRTLWSAVECAATHGGAGESVVYLSAVDVDALAWRAAAQIDSPPSERRASCEAAPSAADAAARAIPSNDGTAPAATTAAAAAAAAAAAGARSRGSRSLDELSLGATPDEHGSPRSEGMSPALEHASTASLRVLTGFTSAAVPTTVAPLTPRTLAATAAAAAAAVSEGLARAPPRLHRERSPSSTAGSSLYRARAASRLEAMLQTLPSTPLHTSIGAASAVSGALKASAAVHRTAAEVEALDGGAGAAEDECEKPSRTRVALLLSVACAHVALSAGLVFGWAALEPLLVREGAFAALCPDGAPAGHADHPLGAGPSGTGPGSAWAGALAGGAAGSRRGRMCDARALRLNLMFTVGTFGNNVSNCLFGALLDRHGPRACNRLAALLLIIGALLLALGLLPAAYAPRAAPAAPAPSGWLGVVDRYFGGYALLGGYLLLGVGGPGIQMPAYQLAALVPRASAGVLSLFAALFNVSECVFSAFAAAHARGAPLALLFAAYALVGAAILGSGQALWPDCALRADDDEEEEEGEEEGEGEDGSAHARPAGSAEAATAAGGGGRAAGLRRWLARAVGWAPAGGEAATGRGADGLAGLSTGPSCTPPPRSAHSPAASAAQTAPPRGATAQGAGGASVGAAARQEGVSRVLARAHDEPGLDLEQPLLPPPTPTSSEAGDAFGESGDGGEFGSELGARRVTAGDGEGRQGDRPPLRIHRSHSESEYGPQPGARGARRPGVRRQRSGTAPFHGPALARRLARRHLAELATLPEWASALALSRGGLPARRTSGPRLARAQRATLPALPIVPMSNSLPMPGSAQASPFGPGSARRLDRAEGMEGGEGAAHAGPRRAETQPTLPWSARLPPPLLPPGAHAADGSAGDGAGRSPEAVRGGGGAAEEAGSAAPPREPPSPISRGGSGGEGGEGGRGRDALRPVPRSAEEDGGGAAAHQPNQAVGAGSEAHALGAGDDCSGGHAAACSGGHAAAECGDMAGHELADPTAGSDDEDGGAARRMVTRLQALPFRRQLRTRQFAHLAAFTSLHALRLNFVLGTVVQQLDRKFGHGAPAERARAARLGSEFMALLPFGFLGLPLIGWLLDARPTAASYVLVDVVGVAYGVLLCTRSVGALRFAFSLVALSQQFLYSTYFAAVAKQFGFLNYGKLSATVNLLVAAVGSLQYPLGALAVSRGFSSVNLLLAACTLPLLASSALELGGWRCDWLLRERRRAEGAAAGAADASADEMADDERRAPLLDAADRAGTAPRRAARVPGLPHVSSVALD